MNPVPEFKTDGFKMLTHLLSMVYSNSTSSKMKAVSDSAALEQAPGDTSGVYMGRVRGIDEVVGNMKVSDLLPLFALANLDTSQYPGLLMRYVINEAKVTNVSIRSLEQEMIDKEGRLKTLHHDGISPDLPTSLHGAKRVGVATPAKKPPLKPAPTPPDTALLPSSQYPPNSFIKWYLTKDAASNQYVCTCSFWRAPKPGNDCVKLHRECGCPGAARADIVHCHDATEAAKIATEYDTKFPPRKRGADKPRVLSGNRVSRTPPPTPLLIHLLPLTS